jgi:hypothetical protein
MLVAWPRKPERLEAVAEPTAAVLRASIQDF